MYADLSSLLDDISSGTAFDLKYPATRNDLLALCFGFRFLAFLPTSFVFELINFFSGSKFLYSFWNWMITGDGIESVLANVFILLIR